MANYCVAAVNTGLFSSSSSWYTNFNTSPGMASSTNSTIPTTGISTVTATAAASSGNIIGVIVIPVASWSGKTITFQLQKDGSNVAGASVAITGANVNLNKPLYVQLTTPVAKVAASVYKFVLSTNTSTCTVASAVQGVATTVAALIIHDTTATPGSGDFFYIETPNGAANMSITLDTNTAAIGGTATSAFYVDPFIRTWDQCVVGGHSSYYGELKFKDNTDTKLSWLCNILFCANGKLTQKPQVGYTSNFHNTGVSITNSASLGFYNGSIIDVLSSTLYTVYKTRVAGGSGTTVSPVALSDAVVWQVGDRVVFEPGTNSSTNYNETEEKFIRTMVDSTHATLADTKGGAESGLTYSHTGAWVQNIERNVIWDADNTNSWHANLNSLDSTALSHQIKGLRLSGMYSTGSAARLGFGTNGYAILEDIVSFDNNTTAAAICLINTGYANPVPWRRWYIGNGGSSGNSQDGRVFMSGCNSKTWEDCAMVAAAKVGWKIQGDNNTWTRCRGVACNNATLPELYASWNLTGNKNTFVDCEAQAQSGYAVLLYGAAIDTTFVNFIEGTTATNGLGVIHKSTSTIAYTTVFFDTPTFTQTTYFDGTANMLEGSHIVLKNVNGTSYNNYKYSNNGESRFTGTGLADTTVPNIGTYAIRTYAVTSTGFKFRYKQLVTLNAVFVTYGRVWGNSTFVSDGSTSITVDLYMPDSVEGADSPDSTVTMTKTTDKTASDSKYNLTAANTVDRPRFANIVITIKNPSATAGAYAYLGDILNSENDTTKFKAVNNGEPMEVMPLGASTDPGAVSTYVWSDTETYPSGSKGAAQDSTLSNSDATQSKVGIL